jgi:hypothetical protein
LNQKKVDNFFGVSKKSSKGFFGHENDRKSENGQKNSFFGGNSGNKAASNWFANTSVNATGNSQKQQNKGFGSVPNGQNSLKPDSKFVNATPLPKKEYNPKDWSLDDFEIGMPIGRGGFGKVYLARTKKDHFVCAIKIVNKAKLTKKYGYLIAREIEIQSQLNHKNILQLYAYFWDKKNIYMVTEYAPDGDLFYKM